MLEFIAVVFGDPLGDPIWDQAPEFGGPDLATGRDTKKASPVTGKERREDEEQRRERGCVCLWVLLG